jgi:hypothetical protein
VQIADFLFYRANKYVIITFGAFLRKYKHIALNTLRNVSGPTQNSGRSLSPCATHVSITGQVLPGMEKEMEGWA